MPSADPFGTKFKHNTRQPQDISEEEEGLLSGVVDSSSKHSDSEPPPAWSQKRIIGTAVFFITLLISGVFVRRLILGPPPRPSHSLWTSGEGELRSNGTHDFKRTVLIISIDGLRCVYFALSSLFSMFMCHCRADYLDRGLTSNLLGISKNGLRAKSMKSIFPVSSIRCLAYLWLIICCRH